MQMSVTLGNPILLFLYSLAILLFGCAIGLHWEATPGVASCLAALGALLMVIHDLATGAVWFWVIAKAASNLDLGTPQ